MDTEKYELCYVAYIDILGFKNMVNESIKNKEVFIKITNLQNYLTSVNKKEGIESKITYFISDSFFFVFPIENNVISSVIWEIADIQAHIINLGFLVRGGITIGDVCYNKKYLFGPSVNEVVALEQKIENPCIVLSNSFLENYILNMDKADHIFSDIESEINDLREYFSCDIEHRWISHINKQDLIIDRDTIKEKLLSMIETGKCTNDERIKKKYSWLEKNI